MNKDSLEMTDQDRVLILGNGPRHFERECSDCHCALHGHDGPDRAVSATVTARIDNADCSDRNHELAEIYGVAVLPELQGQGIGATLIQKCKERAAASQVTHLWLATFKPDYFRRYSFRSISRWSLPASVLQRKLRQVFEQPVQRWALALLGRHTFMKCNLLDKQGLNGQLDQACGRVGSDPEVIARPRLLLRKTSRPCGISVLIFPLYTLKLRTASNDDPSEGRHGACARFSTSAQASRELRTSPPRCRNERADPAARLHP